MFKKIHDRVWAFDAEWVPDPQAGKLLYGLDAETPDAEVMAEMWKRGGATPEDPTPYLKTVLCRMVSISAVVRSPARKEGGQQRGGGPRGGARGVDPFAEPANLMLLSLPRDVSGAGGEQAVVEPFLQAVGKHRPMLVGYNSQAADLRILVQRGLILGIQAAAFCRRPDKPWEGVDYFARGSDWNVDLKEAVTIGWGRGSPSLHEIVTQCGIPGKMEVSGEQVPAMWLEGRLEEIIAYNEFDAVTTYLLWLRTLFFSGRFDAAGYEREQEAVRDLLRREAEEGGKRHLLDYLTEWERLRGAIVR